MENFQEYFEKHIPKLCEALLKDLGKLNGRYSFRSHWEEFESVVGEHIISFLLNSPLGITDGQIEIPEKKSTYPDIKISYKGKLYAIDVKSGEDTRDPWYDISRLDTYEKNHLLKYTAEYSVVIQWKNREKLEILNVFIEPTYRTVGFKKESGGVYYRPYDGKLRPKSWLDFFNGKSYWRDLDHFRRGLEASKYYRWRSQIAQWYINMSPKQQLEIRNMLANIDAGKPIDFEVDSDEDEE